MLFLKYSMKTSKILLLLLFLKLSICILDLKNMIICNSGCTVGCKQCQDTTCSSCEEGYAYINSNQTCQPFPCSIGGCKSCDQQGTCLKCTDEYSYFDSKNGLCVLGCEIENCLKCKSGSKTCQQCKEGFAINSWTGQCILSPISKCMALHDWPQRQFFCSRCSSGFRPTLDQMECNPETCLAVPDCKSCSNSSICSQCRQAYSLLNGVCTKNSCTITNCLYCDTTGACLKAASNSTIVQGSVVQLPCRLQNCATCKTSSSFCDSCLSGFSLNIWTQTCKAYLVSPNLTSASLPDKDSEYFLFWGMVFSFIVVVIVIKIIKYVTVDRHKPTPVDKQLSLESEARMVRLNMKPKKARKSISEPRKISSSGFKQEAKNSMQHPSQLQEPRHKTSITQFGAESLPKSKSQHSDVSLSVPTDLVLNHKGGPHLHRKYLQ